MLPRSLLLLLGAFFSFATIAWGYTLYGYEDAYGIVQLSEKPLNDSYVLLYEGPSDPKWGFAAIKKRIRALGAVTGDRKTDWIRDVTKAYGFMGTAPLGPSGYPPFIGSGPLLDLVRRKSKASGLPPELLYAVIEQESRFAACAVSPKGAAGLMQLMPDTQTTFGVSNPFDPERNVATGAKFLKSLIGRFGDIKLALAAYNAGPETVARCGGIPNIPETVNYVARIMNRYAMLLESHPGLVPSKAARQESRSSKTRSRTSGAAPHPGHAPR